MWVASVMCVILVAVFVILVIVSHSSTGVDSSSTTHSSMSEWHPAWAFFVQVMVALGTLGLAVATVILALKTRGMERVAQEALEVGARPLLVDPSPSQSSKATERLQFGAPGRISPDVPYGQLWYQLDERDHSCSHFSVAFENVGGGVAAIRAWRVTPSAPGDKYVSRKFVPVGALLRVNVSVLQHMPGSEQFSDGWWAMNGVSVEVDYTSTYGGEEFTSIAEIRQYATQGPFVQTITVKRKSDGAVLAEGRGLY
jgi:hypothetical protein